MAAVSLEERERQLRSQDSEIDMHTHGILHRGSLSSPQAISSPQTPPRQGVGEHWQASPMSPSARARAELSESSALSHNITDKHASALSPPISGLRPSATQLSAHVDESLPTESQLRLLRSQVRIARAECEALQSACTEWKGRCSKADASLGAAKAEVARLQAGASAQHTRAEAHKQALEKVSTANKSLEAEVSALRRDMAASRKQHKSADAGASALQARLQRLTEERDALKVQHKQAQASLVSTGTLNAAPTASLCGIPWPDAPPLLFHLFAARNGGRVCRAEGVARGK
jgi:hypothetical protein